VKMSIFTPLFFCSSKQSVVFHLTKQSNILQNVGLFCDHCDPVGFFTDERDGKMRPMYYFGCLLFPRRLDTLASAWSMGSGPKALRAHRSFEGTFS
jgi:hypothetical protein